MNLQGKTIVFDLDGTLCDIMHRLHHIKGETKNWEMFHSECVNDTPKPAIVTLWRALAFYRGYTDLKLIVVSGRSDTVRKETTEWLMRNGIDPDEIIMRPHGDHTPDDQLKQHWLLTGRLGLKENILFCVDDRQRVVDMWRFNGLTCLQVEAWEEDHKEYRLMYNDEV